MNEDKATRYQRLKRRVNLASVAWTASLMIGLLVSGGAVALADLAESIARVLNPPLAALAAVAVFVVLVVTIRETGASLIAYSGRALDRRYGRSTGQTIEWLSDRVRSRVVGVAAGVLVALLLYGCIQWTPSYWWLPAGLAFAVARVAAAHFLPVWLFRVLHRVRPLDDAALRARLDRLTRSMRTDALAVYAWRDDGERGGNAALAGVGSTRAIFISERMLAEYSEAEIEVVAAHELAHHIHRDVWKGLAVEALVTTTGLALAAFAVARLGPVLGLTGPPDVAGLPLIVLIVGLVSLAARPAVYAVSRAAERRADRIALEATGNPEAFVAVVRRLASEHLAEDVPSRLVAWLWHGHPTVAERIAAARAFQASAPSQATGVRRVS